MLGDQAGGSVSRFQKYAKVVTTCRGRFLSRKSDEGPLSNLENPF